jgi:DNA replication protein DnaC
MPPIWTRYRASEISRHSKTIQNKLEMFPEDPRNLLINGKVGRGKTDLAFCLIKKFIEYKAKKEFKKYSMTVPKVFITEALLLIRNVKKIYKDSDEFEFFRSGYDFYFIDGIGDSIPTDDAYCIEQIINYLYIHDKQFIITTNLSPEQFGQRYGERVASRLSECATSLELKGKDWRIPK